VWRQGTVTLADVTPSPRRTGRVPVSATRLAGTLALTVALLVSCNSSPPTATGYFEELSGQMTDLSETVAARQADFGDELSAQLADLHGSTDFTDLAAMAAYFDQAGELAIVKTADLFSQTGSELRGLVDGLEEMEPPPELAVAHEDLITAGSDLVAAIPAATETVRSLDSIDQLRQSLDGSDFATASQRFAIACTNLATAATSAGVAVELECPDLLAVTQVS
jgi:hypothetical protein